MAGQGSEDIAKTQNLLRVSKEKKLWRGIIIEGTEKINGKSNAICNIMGSKKVNM